MLSPEERELRRRERVRRSFSEAAYAHYDPRREGYGSAQEWARVADAFVSGFKVLADRGRGTKSPDMALLFLDEMPPTLDRLKTAFRNALFVHHPDHGGTNEACRNALEAFKRLSKFYP
jgi:hypothetical protein